ncbi:Nucleolar protein 14 [Dillenia turbinata]|uniref:Nucleolar protein 14 n=1 Tax=Dillenia turbinata TaxID=194707 RepID=A0AAN8Z2A4_9MAGN
MQRKKTLLKEYQQSGKSSVFVDNRIGEENDALEEFDKAIMRSQRVRKLKLKKESKYNLSDEEEDEFEGGLGSFSAARDDFDDEIPDDDYDDEDKIDNSSVLKHINDPKLPNSSDTPSMEEEDNKPKTKKEVMEEIIQKSKFFKAQKARDKEENEQLVEELDNKFVSLVQSEVLQSLTQPDKMRALKSLVNKSIPNDNIRKDESLTAQSEKSSEKMEKPDAYDKLVKELALDRRAHPSDRTKTPEEIAEEERERLEQLEEERQKRMLAADDSSDEDGDFGQAINKASSNRVRSVSGDDLGDSFSLDEGIKNRKGWVDEILERKDADDDDESEDGASSEEESESPEDDSEDGTGGDFESVKTGSLKDWEQSDEDLSTDLDEGEDDVGDESENRDDSDLDDDNQDDMEPKSRKKLKDVDSVEIKKVTDCIDSKKTNDKVEQASALSKDLPYVIEAPKTYDELCSLLVNRSNEEILEAVSRIRKYNAISVAAENRKKIQVFYGLLLQYFAVLTSKKPLNFKLLNLLVKPLMEISAEIPYFAAICARQRIYRTRTQFCDDIKNPDKRCWPSLKTIFLFRLWFMIFPCSDFRHVVMTPATLLMCEYLMRCPLLSGRDAAMGTFLCSMVLSVIKESRKFCPEAILFLQTLLMAALNRKPTSSEESQAYGLLELKAIGPLLCIGDRVDEISPLDFIMLVDLPEDSSFFRSDNFRASLLTAVVETLRGFVNTHEGFVSFPEIFLPISSLLSEVAKQENMPDSLQDLIKDVAQLINKKAHEFYVTRLPLQMRKQKPVPIKLLNPKFEENFVKGRDYDPDRERVERKKFNKLLKREAKGAARELRKDNHFLYEVKQREKALLDEERAEMYGKAKAFLQEQEHAFKSGQLGKGRKRRR